jgi:hypothetical protein
VSPILSSLLLALQAAAPQATAPPASVPPQEMTFKVIASPIPGVPLPPNGTLDAELTRIEAARAAAEAGDALARVDADSSLSKKEKAELRKKISSLKVAVFTSPLLIEQVVAFYEKTVPRAEFVFGVRDLSHDLQEGIRAGVIKAPPERVKEAQGKRGRSARWTRDDRISIAIEDQLVDPRDGRIYPKTVVLVTSFGD